MIFKTSLFEVPLYKTTAHKHSEISAWFENYIHPVYEQTGNNDTERSIFSSYFPGAPKLDKTLFDQFYKTNFDEFLIKAGFNTHQQWEVRKKYWYNYGKRGAYQEAHDHLNGPLPVNYAAIHFVKFNKDVHKGTVFYNPLEGVLKSTQPTTKDHLRPNDYQKLQHIVDVNEGDMIFFPSYVPHSVITQDSDEERLTVAINLSIFESGIYERS